MNVMDFTKQMEQMTAKRNRKMDDYMHKASRKIINYCVAKDINTIVTRNNKDWIKGQTV